MGGGEEVKCSDDDNCQNNILLLLSVSTGIKQRIEYPMIDLHPHRKSPHSQWLGGWEDRCPKSSEGKSERVSRNSTPRS